MNILPMAVFQSGDEVSIILRCVTITDATRLFHMIKEQVDQGKLNLSVVKISSPTEDIE